MKKYIATVLLVFVFGVALSQVTYAASDFLAPTSSFYFVQSWKEYLKLFFSFSKESKLNYLEELNNKRISELYSYGKINVQTAEMLANKYSNNYKKIETLALEVQDKSQLAEKIENNSLAQQENLSRVYAQVPEQAKSAILNAQVNSSKNVSAVLEKANPEKVADYNQKIQQIQKIQMVGKIEKAEKESGNAGGNPEGRGPKPLNAIKGGNELNEINDANETGDSQGGVPQMQQAPMQSPASQQ